MTQESLENSGECKPAEWVEGSVGGRGMQGTEGLQDSEAVLCGTPAAGGDGPPRPSQREPRAESEP